jgi:TonB family protein
MSEPSPEWPGWSRQRWLWMVGVGVLAHVVLVFAFGERARPAQAIPTPQPFLHWMETADPAPPAAASSQISDPTLFALPSLFGFSGPAWLAPTPASPPSFDWAEEPRFLPLDTNELGAALVRLLTAPKRDSIALEVLLRPRSTTADVLLFNDPVTTQTVVRVEGPLAGRPLLLPPPVRDPVSPEVLPNTVVQVRVNRDGAIESAILQTGCGVKSVDEQALTAAKAAHFRPAPSSSPPGEFLWGKFIFQWLPVPPPATNAPPP